MGSQEFFNFFIPVFFRGFRGCLLDKILVSFLTNMTAFQLAS